MRETTIKTFFYSFLISIVSILLVVYTIANGSNEFYLILTSNWRSIWIVFVASALISLAFTFFNAYDNWNIERKFNRDLKKVSRGELVGSDALDEVANKIMNLTKQLQVASKEDSVKHAEIVTEERKRISRELHDSVSQQLFAATMILSGISDNKNLSKEQMSTQVSMVLKILHEAQNEMRALLLHLRPVELNGSSLIEGITGLVNELQAKIDGNISWTYDQDLELSSTVEDNIFRIVQELLSNALRHSKAKKISISLLNSGTNVLLKVTDDGVGFDTSQTKSASYGLKNIKERSVLLGGDAKIISAPNQGTSIEIRAPKNEY